MARRKTEAKMEELEMEADTKEEREEKQKKKDTKEEKQKDTKKQKQSTKEEEKQKKKKKRNQNSASAEELTRSAIEMIDQGDMIRCINSTHWEVRSQSDPNKWYRIDICNKGIKCECAYHKERKDAACKHARMVEIMMLQEAQGLSPGEEFEEGVEEVVVSEVGVVCPNDRNHKNIVENGMRTRKKRKAAQRYRCNDCGKRFSGDVGFTGRHYEPWVILLSLFSFAAGMSPANISLMLAENFEVRVDVRSVQRWADDYAAMVEKYAKTLAVRVGSKWSSDEKGVSVKGKQYWIFTVIDTATKFVLACDVSAKKQRGYDARNLFQSAMDRAGHGPMIFVTDGLAAFATGFKKVFYRLRGCPYMALS